MPIMTPNEYYRKPCPFDPESICDLKIWWSKDHCGNCLAYLEIRLEEKDFRDFIEKEFGNLDDLKKGLLNFKSKNEIN